MIDPATSPPSLSRRRFIAGSAATTLASGLGTVAATALPGERPSGRRPNIVMILADDLGWNEVGAYGQQHIRTPTLDRLATEGVRYTDFYAGGPVCAPARCALLTGLHTGHATVRNNPMGGAGDEPLAADEVTFGHVLAAVGYRTALFGKWGFSPDAPDHHSHPNAQGFDEFFGYLTHIHAHSYYPTYLWHNDQRVELPENAENARVTYAPDVITERCLDFVRGHHDEPFAIFWSTTIPHAPQDVPDVAPYADTDWGPGEKAHAAQITRMDADIGRLIALLEDLGIAEDTVVLFCGDNGPHEEGAPAFDPDFFEANGPFRGYKRNLLEGGIRVPAIAWAPGRRSAPAGAVVDRPWAMWDVLPTFAELAGAPAPPYVDGLSMRALITGEADAPDHDDLYWWRLEPYSSPRAKAAENGSIQRAAEACRQGRWKAVRYAPGQDRDVSEDQWKVELYDLATDRSESVDLAAAQPEVAAALVATMRASWTPPPLARESWSPTGVSVDAARQFAPGRETSVTVTFTNHDPRLPATHIDLRLELPPGWTVSRPDESPARVLRPGRSTTVGFAVVAAPADPSDPSDPSGPSGPSDPSGPSTVAIIAAAEYRSGAVRRTATVSRPVTLLPAPPGSTSYVSDLPWISAANGWGPVERDLSNGRDAAGDGPPIALAGRVYAKGLGVHAPSEVVVHLGGACDRFTADIGIDDFSADQGSNGSVVFQVFADDVAVHDSGLVTAAGGPQSVDVSTAGAQRLRLVVTDGGDGNRHDHASWAEAMVHVADPPRRRA